MPGPRGDAPYLRPEGSAPAGPIAFAHRGFSPGGGENTLAAFRAAVDLGYRYLETDVRTSRDGVLMVFHDETLDRLTEADGPVSAHTAAELQRLAVEGVDRIPTLDELLEEWPDVHLNVDVKDAAGAELLARSVAAHRAGHRVLAASFSERRRRAAVAASGGVLASSASTPGAAAVLALGPVGLGWAARPLLEGVCAFQVPVRQKGIRVVTPAFVSRAHRLGLQVHVWVVDDRAEMERLLDLGVDGLVSDRADVLAEVMAERGFWPQRPPA